MRLGVGGIRVDKGGLEWCSVLKISLRLDASRGLGDALNHDAKIRTRKIKTGVSARKLALPREPYQLGLVRRLKE